MFCDCRVAICAASESMDRFWSMDPMKNVFIVLIRKSTSLFDGLACFVHYYPVEWKRYWIVIYVNNFSLKDIRFSLKIFMMKNCVQFLCKEIMHQFATSNLFQLGKKLEKKIKVFRVFSKIFSYLYYLLALKLLVIE